MPVFLGQRLHFFCLQNNFRGGSRYRSMEFNERKVPLFYFALPRVTSNLHTELKDIKRIFANATHLITMFLCEQAVCHQQCQNVHFPCFVLFSDSEGALLFFGLFMSLYRPQSSLSHFVISHRRIYYWVCITKAMCVCVVRCSYITHWPGEETGR